MRRAVTAVLGGAALLGTVSAYTQINCGQCKSFIQSNPPTTWDGYANELTAYKNCCQQCDADGTNHQVLPVPARNPRWEGGATASVWLDPTYIVDNADHNPDYMQVYIDAGVCPPRRNHLTGEIIPPYTPSSGSTPVSRPVSAPAVSAPIVSAPASTTYSTYTPTTSYGSSTSYTPPTTTSYRASSYTPTTSYGSVYRPSFTYGRFGRFRG
uniref:Uncharacterized protein n=1 Tax=Chromera velia CCMP2878 TaxID=1169474 RepID=A0A0G4G919_9ALVE|mmetsp:Transcript_38175/g.74987  ORF Transcript_38175/g.74987 Transcript_38175/m.74987 type:complete len:211 (+) Transcript_38175:88-720(+)|eukprot:Cvel_600.t1-p1 / transcript=Cvel_600.t1 / gene=Cvel_600 / organism=Chromera_velia_CCMP2878 / gene_product=hypothetical protein / transcript_product=hypothetical protein / location=Cvel_scaffold18:151872-152501(+) / protein_length=210 / sequence_SO=supercontig / SO=protein_coding / is_pseudo=false